MISKHLDLNDNIGSEGSLFNPFGPPIMHVSANKNIINNIKNLIIDFINKTDNKITGIIHGTDAKDQENNSIVKGEIAAIPYNNDIDILNDYINKITYQYSISCFTSTLSNRFGDQVYTNIEEIVPKITSLWYVILKEGDFHIIHDHAHSDCMFSGAIYLDCPNVPDPQSKISWIMSGSSNLLHNNVWGVVPKTGDIFIWPSWMSHTVYPFRGDGERLMISFNSKIVTNNDK